MNLQNKHEKDDRWIFERNPDTEEIFRRKVGEPHSSRECINPEVRAPKCSEFIDKALNLNGQEWVDFVNSLSHKQKIQLSRCWD
mgnify:CR=1 FL=1